MRTHGSLKVLPLAVLVVLLTVTSVGALCRTGRPGYQYWDELREICRNCSVCTQPGHIVIRPCQVYQDTTCGPLHTLNIDWSWLGYRPRNESHHSKQGSRSNQWSSTFSNSSHVNHRYYKQNHRVNGTKFLHHHHHHHLHNKFHHHKKLRPPESAAQLKTSDENVGNVALPTVSPIVQATPAQLQQPLVFTTPEALVWDWQAIVLVLAVFACVLFFGIAAGYGVRQVRHDSCRSTDVEDLSAALGLMMPGVGSEPPENSPTAVDTCNTNQCLYMEKLLVSKQPDGHGNVYINRDNTGSPRL